MTIPPFQDMGPINALVLLLCLGAGLGVAIHTTLRLRRGQEVRLLPIVLALAAPLLFGIYAATWQHQS